MAEPKRPRRRRPSGLTALPSVIIASHINPFFSIQDRARVRSTSRVLRQDIPPYAGPKEPSFIVSVDGDPVGMYSLSHIPQLLDDITSGRWSAVLGSNELASIVRFTAVVGANQPPLHLAGEGNVVAFDIVADVPWAAAAAPAALGSEFVDLSQKRFDDFTVGEVLLILHETAEKLAITARQSGVA